MTHSKLSFDPGAGAIKAVFGESRLLLPSAVAVNGQHRLHSVAGLKSRKRPLAILTRDGEFYVGAGAHDFGRPVENLDFDRLTGSPEMRALFYATLSRLLPANDEQSIDLIVGLPIAVLTGDEAPATIKLVKEFLSGVHTWQVDGHQRAVTVNAVQITGQPVGALFEFFLDENGATRPEHKAAYDREVGVLNIGMSTVDLLASRRGQPVERFTAGESIGVRRLLTMLNSEGIFSLAELDEQLRAGQLEVNSHLKVWAREVTGYIDTVWGKSRGRFSRLIATGGGVHLLREILLRKFGVMFYTAADPVMATANGLYRFGLMQARKEK